MAHGDGSRIGFPIVHEARLQPRVKVRIPLIPNSQAFEELPETNPMRVGFFESLGTGFN
jgi:hypothetical protein